MDKVLPNVEELQSYVWRRHLASAAHRMLGDAGPEGVGTSGTTAVEFVDIVGYTSQSKNLTEAELVAWVEYFEDEMTRTVVEHGGRVIKTIGDEILFVADDPRAAAEIALHRHRARRRRGRRVPASCAPASRTARWSAASGTSYGPTVNIAARLTSVARPGTVLVDRGLHEVLSVFFFFF